METQWLVAEMSCRFSQIIANNSIVLTSVNFSLISARSSADNLFANTLLDAIFAFFFLGWFLVSTFNPVFSSQDALLLAILCIFFSFR